MKLSKIVRIVFIAALATGMVSCKDGNSVFDPNYEPSRPNPVVTDISPAGGYLAGVDSVIVTGENFATDPDSVTINFGGFPGIVKSATPTRLVVRPGTKHGEDLSVRVSVRGAELFSDNYPYTLFQPFGLYTGLVAEDKPTSPVAIDADNNIYTIIDRAGVIRYTKITPDGTITKDMTRYPGEPRPNDDPRPYPNDSTMRFTNYSTMVVGPSGDLFMAQQGLRAIFTKTFGDNIQESVWKASSNGDLQIRDIVFDNNGFVWAVGFGSNRIHRFTYSTRTETTFPFEAELSSVAFFSNENQLFVGGEINGSQKVWRFNIDGGGNLNQGELYFDFGQYYDGTVKDMILASNGELMITTGALADGEERDESIVRVFPNGKHQRLYEGMLKPGAFSITWRDDKYAVVTIQNEDENSINFLDMYDRERAGIFGLN